MATYHKLEKRTTYNPYILNGNTVKRIRFYTAKYSKLIGTINRGWVSTIDSLGGENLGNDVIESLTFRVRFNTGDYLHEEHFVLPNSGQPLLYVNVDLLPEFRNMGEILIKTDEDGTNFYGKVIQFKFAYRCSEAMIHRIQMGNYTRTEHPDDPSVCPLIEEKLVKIAKNNDIEMKSLRQLLKLSPVEKHTLISILK